MIGPPRISPLFPYPPPSVFVPPKFGEPRRCRCAWAGGLTMNDVTIIDRFLDTFSRYIDSGFGLLHGEVAFLTATLIVIDMTLAGLFWAMSHATGQIGRASCRERV